MTDMDKVLAICPLNAATVVVAQSGPMSALVLNDGDRVYVPPGITLTLDIQTPKLKWLRVGGSLITQVDANTRLHCETIVSDMGSVLKFGDHHNEVTGQCDVVFADFGPMDFTADPWAMGRGLIAMGMFEACGEKRTARVRTLGNMAGERLIRFQKPVAGWIAGDSIAMAGTSCLANEDEELSIVSVAADGMSMVLNAPLLFDHVRLADAKTGLYREMFVINRSKRTVHFTSESTDPKRFGHIMVMSGHGSHGHGGMTDICHAGFVNLGRTDKALPVTDPDGFGNGLENARGRYMLHFHLNGGTWTDEPHKVEECYFEGSPGWGLVNHGSYVNRFGCAAYKIFGGHLVSEIGTEIGELRECSMLRTTCLVPIVNLQEPASPTEDHAKNGHGIWTHCGGEEIYDCDVAGFPKSHGVFLMGFAGSSSFKLPPDFTTEVVFPGVNIKGTCNTPSILTSGCAPALAPQVIDGLNVFACGEAVDFWQVGLNITPTQAPVRNSTVKNCWFEASLQSVFFGYMTWMDFENIVIPDPIPSATGPFAAVGHSGFTGGISWTNLSMLSVAGRQRWPSAIPGWTSQTNTYVNCAIRADVGISIPQVFHRVPRRITFDAATTFDCPMFKVRLRMNHFGANLYTGDPRYPMLMPFMQNGQMCYWDDVVKVGDKFLHYPELADDFPYSSVLNIPPHAVGHTNATFWEKYHTRIGMKLLPADAVQGTDGIQAYVSSGPPTVLPDIWVTQSSRSHGAFQQTVNADGPLIIQDATGEWIQTGPYVYTLGLNCPQTMVDGFQLGVWVNRIPDGAPYPNRQAYDWWVTQPPASTPIQPALPLPNVPQDAPEPPTPTPAPTITIAASPTSGVAPLSVSFAAVVTNATGVVWDFGDGTTGNALTITHPYASAGDFTATATATGQGGTATASVAIRTMVLPVPPTPVEYVVIPKLSWEGEAVYKKVGG